MLTSCRVTIAGGVRFWFLWGDNVHTSVQVVPSTLAALSLGYVTSTIETNLGIITGSAPALWPLARRWFPGMFQGLRLSQGYTGRLSDIEVANRGIRRESEKKAGGLSVWERLNGRKPAATYTGDNDRMFRRVRSAGSTLLLNRLVRGDRRMSRRIEIRGGAANESEEKIMTLDGITLTTDFIITMDEETRKSRIFKHYSRPGSGFRFHQTPRSPSIREDEMRLADH
jgi:hypothetical protein